jgi:hypothetical protein
MNTGGFSNFLDHCDAVDGYIKYISVAGLGFAPNKPGLNLVIFVLSVGSVSAAS